MREQEFLERRTYGPDEHFEGDAVTEEHGNIGNLLRGGQARHHPGEGTHEGWTESDMNRQEGGQQRHTGDQRRQSGSQHRQRGNQSRQSGNQHRQTGNRDRSDRSGQQGGRSKRYGRRSRELSDRTGGRTGRNGGESRGTGTRSGESRRTGDTEGTARTGSNEIGEYARRGRDTPRHTETGGRGTPSLGSGGGDQRTTRQHSGTDEEGRTDRPDFGDIGPMGGENARQSARRQGHGGETPDEYDATRRSGNVPETGRGGNVTGDTLDRGTTSHSRRFDAGDRRAGDTGTTGGSDRSSTNRGSPDRGTDRTSSHQRSHQSQQGDAFVSEGSPFTHQEDYGEQHGSQQHGTDSHRGSDRGGGREGSGALHGSSDTDRSGHYARRDTTRSDQGAENRSPDAGTTERGGQQSNRQHGTRRQSRRSGENVQGSQRGSGRGNDIAGVLGGHFGSDSANERTEASGEQRHGGERGVSDRDHQFGSRHGHGTRRRERPSDRETENR